MNVNADIERQTTSRKRLILASLILGALVLSTPLVAADTDGDGLLDLIDAPGFPEFPADATGNLSFSLVDIQDLDGASLLTSLESLRIRSGGLTSIEASDFYRLENLIELTLATNAISSIESGAFADLSNLRELDLSHNPLGTLKSGILDGLGILERLDLHSTELVDIKTGAFEGLPNLRNLNLHDNLFTRIDAGMFSGLHQLESISFWSGRVEQIESGAFEGLSNLGNIDLHGNSLTELPANLLAGLTELWSLELDRNQLIHLEDNLFADMSQLRTLLLYANELTELNFTGATLDSLNECGPVSFLIFGGFCADGSVDSLVLDSAELSNNAFEVILGETTNIADVSLVGLSFSDGYPDDLDSLLGITTLRNVRIDTELFNRYAEQLTAFAAVDGNTLTVVPEVSTGVLACLGILSGMLPRRRVTMLKGFVLRHGRRERFPAPNTHRPSQRTPERTVCAPVSLFNVNAGR